MKKNSKKKIQHICFTGHGAKKNHNHNKNEFIEVMDKNYESECGRFFKTKKCKSCKTAKKIRKKLTKSNNKKISNKYEKVNGRCVKCKKNYKKCSLKKYIEYSGALIGKCKDVLKNNK